MLFSYICTEYGYVKKSSYTLSSQKRIRSHLVTHIFRPMCTHLLHNKGSRACCTPFVTISALPTAVRYDLRDEKTHSERLSNLSEVTQGGNRSDTWVLALKYLAILLHPWKHNIAKLISKYFFFKVLKGEFLSVCFCLFFASKGED